MNKMTSHNERKQGYITASDWSMPQFDWQLPDLDWSMPDLDWSEFLIDMQGSDFNLCSIDINWMNQLYEETPANIDSKTQGRKSHIVKP